MLTYWPHKYMLFVQTRGLMMAIQKQEFYEGAALHLIARSEQIVGILVESPFFLLNGRLLVLLKYSTKGRSPWGFTFTLNEQQRLCEKATKYKTKIGLICGADGVATFDYEEYLQIAAPRSSAIHVACYREHGGYYEINGPDGTLGRKIAPSSWQKILD